MHRGIIINPICAWNTASMDISQPNVFVRFMLEKKARIVRWEEGYGFLPINLRININLETRQFARDL